jgi:ABC-type dipeptide/oligopeptide/nickel transport system permease subunit
MTIEQAVFLYAVIFCVFLVPLVWLLLRRRAEKKAKNAKMDEIDANTEARARPAIDWRALYAYRPQDALSGEMWLKAFIAAFVALCVGVIVVVFVFPLGALWAASAAFLAVIVIVAVIFALLG